MFPSFIIFFLIFFSTASAHPIDEIGNISTYDQKQTLHIAPDRATLSINLTFYGLEKNTVWESIDTNSDQKLSESEKSAWLNLGSKASFLEADGQKLYFTPSLLDFPDFYNFFASNTPSQIKLEFDQNHDFSRIQNLNYYYLGKDKQLDEITFISNVPYTKLSPQSLNLDLAKKNNAQLFVKNPSSDSLNNFLDKYVKADNLPPFLIIISLLASFAIGALHALTPGHGKALVAGFLVGEKGTILHAVYLGIIITLTHTASVFTLGVISLFLTQYIAPVEFAQWLTIVSGLLIFLFGIFLIISRIKNLKTAAAHDHHHTLNLTWKSLLPLGIGSGIVPCIDALAILLVAINLQKIILGLVLLLFFSLGLASALITLGIIIIFTKNRLPQLNLASRYISLISAILVTLLGFAILFNSWATKVEASGTFAHNIFSQSLPVSSQALIIHDGSTETVFDSLTYNINPVTAWDFGWIIAVPAKPEVTAISDDLFTRLEKIAKAKSPYSLYTRPSGVLNIQVFSPENKLEDLETYLTQYGFYIPKQGRYLIDSYLKKGWYIIASDIDAASLQLDASESLTVTGAHTFPLKITFKSDQIIYPQLLTTIQPDYDSKDIPLNYPYGSSSSAVLTKENPAVDGLLQYQSKNTYAYLPHNYVAYHTRLYVITSRPVHADSFTKLSTRNVSQKDIEFKDVFQKPYYQLPKKNMKLTVLESFIPILQLQDVYIKQNKFLFFF